VLEAGLHSCESTFRKHRQAIKPGAKPLADFSSSNSFLVLKQKAGFCVVPVMLYFLKSSPAFSFSSISSYECYLSFFTRHDHLFAERFGSFFSKSSSSNWL